VKRQDALKGGRWRERPRSRHAAKLFVMMMARGRRLKSPLAAK